MKVVILGGGIAGLSCAWYLEQELGITDYILLEAAGQFGGKIQTAMIIASALIEGVALFGVVVCLLISFKA